MAEDEDRAARIAELKKRNPKLTWAKIADRVGVSERAATRWQRTGALKPENAEALAQMFGVDFDYIWTGPRPDTPDLFVDRRHNPQLNGGGSELTAMRAELAGLRSEVADLRRERAEGIETIQRYLERQDRILRNIEDAISRETAARSQTDEATERLMASVDAASQALSAETRIPAAKSPPRAK